MHVAFATLIKSHFLSDVLLLPPLIISIILTLVLWQTTINISLINYNCYQVNLTGFIFFFFWDHSLGPLWKFVDNWFSIFKIASISDRYVSQNHWVSNKVFLLYFSSLFLRCTSLYFLFIFNVKLFRSVLKFSVARLSIFQCTLSQMPLSSLFNFIFFLFSI